MPQDVKTGEPGNEAAWPTLKLDPDEYREDLVECGLSKEQEDELLQALWHIMSTFVDIGWGVDTVQLFLPDLFEKAGADSDNLLQKSDLNQCDNTTSPLANGKDKHHDE